MSSPAPTVTEPRSGWSWDYSATGTQNNAVSASISAASRVEGYEWVVIPSIVLLALTIGGALMILGSMAWLEYRGRPSTTRTRLVQALVVSDLVLGIVGLIGNAIDITPGQRLVQGTATCNGLGFVLIAVLWTEHVWTLCLAIGTYLILIHPLHALTLMLEKHWIWLWALVWLSAIVIATITEVLYGFQPSGGICYYPQSAGLYAELMQFIPRAVVFIGITFLYARLYVFLKRPDKIRSPYSNSPTGMSYDSSAPKRKIQGFLRKFSGGEKGTPAGETTPPAVAAAGAAEEEGERPAQAVDEANEYDRSNRPTMRSDPQSVFAASTTTNTFRPSSAPVSPATEIPPWERMELPVFHVDGQRYGGPSAGGGAGASQAQQGMFGGWKGLGGGGGGGGAGKKRPSTANSSGSNSPAPHQGRMGSISTASRILQQQQDTERRGSGGNTTRSRQASGDTTLYSNGTGGSTSVYPRKMSSSASATAASTANGSATGVSGLLPGMARRPSAVPPDTSPVLEQDNETFVTADRDRERHRAGGGASASADVSRRNSHSQSDAERAEAEAEDQEDEDAEMDLLRMLRQDNDPDVGRNGSGDTGGEYELVPESMASYLNRKTALLMLWFPLGYVLLFSISLIRVIYDFVGRPPDVLRAMSRWFVFAQGVLDALIYGLVEWHTKRVVRRRVRKGALTPGGSRGTGTGSGIQSAIRSIQFRRSNNQNNNVSSRKGSKSIITNTQDIELKSQSQQQRSTHLQHPSILQELELEVDLDSQRKGSWTTSSASEGKETRL